VIHLTEAFFRPSFKCHKLVKDFYRLFLAIFFLDIVSGNTPRIKAFKFLSLTAACRPFIRDGVTGFSLERRKR